MFFLLQLVKVLEYDRKIINDDRVKIRVLAAMEPHPMSPYGDEDFGYQTIKNSIRQIWTNATVVPGTYSTHAIRPSDQSDRRVGGGAGMEGGLSLLFFYFFF